MCVCLFVSFFVCRYLVDMRWMKQWKKYVKYDQLDQSLAGQETANPGPVDNSNLFKGGCVRLSVVSSVDLVSVLCGCGHVVAFRSLLVYYTQEVSPWRYATSEEIVDCIYN